MSNSSHPQIPRSTSVQVIRTINTFGERIECPVQTIQQAITDNDLTTSGGSVSVQVAIVDGPHAGASAYEDENHVWRAHYDPETQLPNGRNRYQYPDYEDGLEPK
jgi:hypothetical protein